MDKKRAPVQGYSAGIPWEMHLRAYDGYCKKHGPQESLIDLENRNCRGGFHTGELDDFIPGWREEVDENTRLRAEVERLQRLEAAAKHLRTQSRKQTMGCNWRCRNMRDLFAALEPEEASD